jgi:hypothetical protein
MLTKAVIRDARSENPLQASRDQMQRDYANHTNTIGDTMQYGIFSSLWHDNIAPSNGFTVRSRANTETEFHRRRTVANEVSGDLMMFYFLVKMVEGIGLDGFRAFNRLHREMQAANEHGIMNMEQGDALVLAIGLATGYNLTPFFQAYRFPISRRVQDLLGDRERMYILIDYVEDAELRAQLVAEQGMLSEFGLIRGSALRAAGVEI